MLVTAGGAKGHRLKSSKTKNLNPIISKVRGPLLDSIADRVIGARVLDLYAGTGSLGIDSLSRGAIFCDFVERDHQACEAIKQNLQHSHFVGKSRVFCKDTMDFIATSMIKYDLVFMDPPSHDLNHFWIFKILKKNLKTDSLIVVHVPGFFNPSSLVEFKVKDQKIFGQEKFFLISPK